MNFLIFPLIVTESVETLEKRLNALEGVKSPGPSVKPVEVINDSSSDNDIKEIEKEKDGEVDSTKKKLRFSITGDEKDLNDVVVLSITKNLKNPTLMSKAEHGHSSKDNLMSEESQRNKRPVISPHTCDIDPKKQKRKQSKSPKLKELGHQGPGVWISREQLNDAKSKPSFAPMNTSLLASVFPKEILLKSNYKGGASKNTEKKEVNYGALDDNLLRLIKGTV
ncbi:hypothetical protein KQX54_018499 [Cotesia glomerata]|uniref:Uncharacterized protein n=1 Tax=Cotesia glomerata TaxID=32391 RepID=A0AAV7IP37_COTGL|nr:hypothetical protein KQX54_018499 [Cotesia glomerata]